MRVKFVMHAAGPLVSYEVNDEIEFEDAEAIRLIEAGIAVPVRGKKIETATIKPTENTK